MEVLVFLIHVVIELVDGCSALTATLVYLACFYEVGHFAYLLAEIALVQFFVQYGFVEFLNLAHSEFLGQELKCYGSVSNLVLQSALCLLHHLHVVKVKCWKVVGVYPLAVEFLQ